LPSKLFFFSRKATSSRQWLLQQLETRLPGFEYIGFTQGKPSVFQVRIGDSGIIDLHLREVESFIAGLRIGCGHVRKELNAEETRRILAQEI